MAQAGLSDEKNWQSKISLDCPFKERRERFAFKKERQLANRSRHSLQNSSRERLALFHERITLLLTKNKRFARKTDERIPNPALTLLFRAIIPFPYSLQFCYPYLTLQSYNTPFLIPYSSVTLA